MNEATVERPVVLHLWPIGQWSAVRRRTADPGVEGLLQEVARGEIVRASLTCEPRSRT